MKRLRQLEFIFDEQDETVEKAIKYLRSKEGARAFTEAILEAKKRTDELSESMRVDWRTMHEPMTI